MLSRAKNLLLDMLFPRACLVCRKTIPKNDAHAIVCNACLAAVPLYDALHCPTCMRRLPHGAAPCHPAAHYVMAGAARYSNETVQKLILQMKYEGWASASPPLGSLFSSYLKNLPHDFKDYHVVPVPLHKNKEWRRGFNQAALLGGAVSTALHLPVINRNLVRIKETAAQTDQADYTTREANIAGAFHIEHPHEFKGKNILLIDDVTTSGATLREAARTLKAAGVKKIIGAVAARAH